MTVVRVSDHVDVRALVETDPSVSAGFLTVEVREWDVRFEG